MKADFVILNEEELNVVVGGFITQGAVAGLGISFALWVTLTSILSIVGFVKRNNSGKRITKCEIENAEITSLNNELIALVAEREKDMNNKFKVLAEMKKRWKSWEAAAFEVVPIANSRFASLHCLAVQPNRDTFNKSASSAYAIHPVCWV